VKFPEKYASLGQSVLLNIDFLEALATENLTLGILDDLEEKSMHIIEKYPDYLPIYSFIGHIQILLKKYESAIPALLKALTVDGGDLIGVYRNLVIAYANTN